MWHDMNFWRTVTIITAAIGQTLFVALYLTWPWWKEFLGRALFTKAVSLGALLDVAVIGRLTDWPKEDFTFVTLYGLVALGIWIQLIAFLRVRMSSTSGRGVGRDD